MATKKVNRALSTGLPSRPSLTLAFCGLILCDCTIAELLCSRSLRAYSYHRFVDSAAGFPRFAFD